MSTVAWADLDAEERRNIAILGAGLSVNLCDPVAHPALTRLGLVKGSRLTVSGEALRKAIIMQELACKAHDTRAAKYRGRSAPVLREDAGHRRQVADVAVDYAEELEDVLLQRNKRELPASRFRAECDQPDAARLPYLQVISDACDSEGTADVTQPRNPRPRISLCSQLGLDQVPIVTFAEHRFSGALHMSQHGVSPSKKKSPLAGTLSPTNNVVIRSGR